jgi:chemosensory pili system protein ChpA (sensor histidine kinase/response regulator)
MKGACAVGDIGLVPLGWIKGEVDLALERACESFARFREELVDLAPIADCQTHLHQATGAIQIVGLDGLACFSQEVEHTLDALAARRIKPVPSVLGLIDRGFLALRQFLDDLVKGRPYVPLNLLSLYQELQQARGVAATSAIDLFFPNLNVQLPTTRSAQVLPGQLPAFLQSQRTRFQRGLLEALRKPDAAGGKTIMQETLLAVEQVRSTSPDRALWWVAAGFIEALAQNEIPFDVEAKQVLSRVDLQLRNLAQGGVSDDSERLLRGMLYRLALVPDLPGRIAQIRETYRLDDYLADTTMVGVLELDDERLRELVRGLETQLAEIKEAWARCSAGSPQALAQFQAAVGRAIPLFDEIGVQPLTQLIEVIRKLAIKLGTVSQRAREVMALDMATALLLVENALNDCPDVSEELHEQLRAMSEKLDALADGRPYNRSAPALARLEAASRKVEEKQVVGQVVREIRTNLLHVEQVLDEFFRDHSRQPRLKELDPIIAQTRGALDVLGLDHAVQLLEACAARVRQLAQPGTDIRHPELELLAEGLSAIGFSLDAAETEQPQPDDMIASLLQRLAGPATTVAAPVDEGPAPMPKADEAPAAPREDAPAPAAAAEPAPAAIDPELLEVYLVEAGEVLETVNEHLAACRQQPADRDSLTVVRRGFHTLKGSGRMVGLNDLGEVAWEIEQLLNRWLESNKPATPDLLDTVARAHDAFGGWVAELSQGRAVRIDADALIADARALRDGAAIGKPAASPAPKPAAPAVENTVSHRPAEAPAPAEQPVPEALIEAPAAALEAGSPAIESDAVTASDEVHVGETTLSRTLYEIFADEAAVHMAVLERECGSAAAGKPVSAELVRAAHTLASSAGTAGFVPMRALASALEHFLNRTRGDDRVLTRTEHETTANSVAALRRMLDAVANCVSPQPEDALVQALGEFRADASVGAMPATEMYGQLLTPGTEADDEADAAVAPETAAAEKHDEPVITEIDAAADAEANAVDAGAADQSDGLEKIAAIDDAIDAPSSIAVEDRRVLYDDVDPEVLGIFLEEAQELMPAIGRDLREWQAHPAERLAPDSLQRLLHTVKGGARTAGLMRLGELSHNMETVVVDAIAANNADERFFEKLTAQFDRLATDIERLQHSEGAPVVAGAVPAAAVREELPDAPAPEFMLRVRASTVERLVNEAGETSIARGRIETEMVTIRRSLLDLTDSVERMRAQLREVEIQAETQLQAQLSLAPEQEQAFDPLEFDRYTRLHELTRLMAESLHDITTVQQSLLGNIDETELALTHQVRLNRGVQEELMRMQTVPLAHHAERLHRIVRQTAHELGKKAQLVVHGSEVELDRSVLERIVAPLEHMVRNSIAHGIETPQQRAAAGKPESGQVTLDATQEGNEIVIRLSDDGRGLDLDAIERRARARGLLVPGQTVDAARLTEMIFASGFSTAEQVTEIAGRGVGMDVVKNEIAALGGRVETTTRSGRGAAFTVYLPLTLAVAQVVLVSAARRTYAIPASLIEHVKDVRAAEVPQLRMSEDVEWQGSSYPLFYLPHMLGHASAEPPVIGYSSLLFLRSRAGRVAVHIDKLAGNAEVVVKRIGPQVSGLPWIAGATVLASGDAALIINPLQLITFAHMASAFAETTIAVEEAPAPLIMVVDDSLTVRKVTSRLLSRENYRVATAKDGIDALEQLKDIVPDVMLVDIEMPRMDGFDLVRNVRANAETAKVPVIMISSRTADKHRDHAFELGVNRFLGKPYEEGELLAQIAEYLGRKEPVAAVA